MYQVYCSLIKPSSPKPSNPKALNRMAVPMARAKIPLRDRYPESKSAPGSGFGMTFMGSSLNYDPCLGPQLVY